MGKWYNSIAGLWRHGVGIPMMRAVKLAGHRPLMTAYTSKSEGRRRGRGWNLRNRHPTQDQFT